MLIHKQCGMPLIADDTRLAYFEEVGIMGLFCTICLDEDNKPLEVTDETQIESYDMETQQR